MPHVPLSQAPTLPSVEQSLTTMTVDDLKWYASVFANKVPTRKADLIRLLVQSLTNPFEVRRLWDQLSPVQQNMVAEVAHVLGGRYDTQVIEAKYSGAAAPANPRGYGGYFVYYGSGRKQQTATPFDILFVYDYDLGRYIPSDLLVLLRAIAPPPAPTELRSHADISDISVGKTRGPRIEVTVAATEQAAFHDLAATLYLVQQGKIAVSATTKAPTLTSLRQLRLHLLEGDYLADQEYNRAEDAIRPFALTLLVQAAKWTQPGGSSGKLELTKSGMALPTGTLQPEHIRDAWNRWIKSDLLDELSRIRAIKGQQSKAARLTKPTERREKLVAALRVCPVGQWVELDEFFRYMRAESLSPVIERNAETALYVGPYQEYGSLVYSSNYWDVVIGSYLRAVLWEYAATLGLIEIAYTTPESVRSRYRDVYGLDAADYLSRYDGLLAIRLTHLGAFVLGLTDSYTAPVATLEPGRPALHVLPNLDIVVTDATRLTLGDRAMLERIGTAENQGVYRLDREQILEATQQGLSLEQIQTLLASKSGIDASQLPQTVQVFFNDVAQRLSALRDSGRMILLEGDDPYLVTELANTSGLRAMVRLATLDGKPVLLVPEEREAMVRRHLRKLGYVPQKRQGR